MRSVAWRVYGDAGLVDAGGQHTGRYQGFGRGAHALQHFGENVD
jgi:hypothetical protein